MEVNEELRAETESARREAASLHQQLLDALAECDAQRRRLDDQATEHARRVDGLHVAHAGEQAHWQAEAESMTQEGAEMQRVVDEQSQQLEELRTKLEQVWSRFRWFRLNFDRFLQILVMNNFSAQTRTELLVSQQAVKLVGDEKCEAERQVAALQSKLEGMQEQLDGLNDDLNRVQVCICDSLSSG